MLECQQTYKCEYVVQILSVRLEFEKKSLLWGFMLLLRLSTWGNNVSKNTSFLYSRNSKNMRHMRQHKAITKTEPVVFFVSFWLLSFFSLCLHAHSKVCITATRAPIGSSRLCHKCDLAQRHSTLAIAHRDAAGHCGVRGSQAGRGPNREGVVAWLAPLPPGAGWEIMLRWLTSCSPAIMTGGSEAMTRWSLELRKR